MTTDIRTWGKGADAKTPALAWDIYVDSSGQVWLHDQEDSVFYQVEKYPRAEVLERYSVGWISTEQPPDGLRLLIAVIADDVLDGLEGDAEETG